MLEFEQWLEVEKVVAKEKVIKEILKDCWDYSAKKTKEDDEESIKEWYENKVEYLNMENGELENENDELGCKCDELENIVSKVKNIIKEVLEFNKIMDDFSLRTKNALESILDIIDDYC